MFAGIVSGTNAAENPIDDIVQYRQLQLLRAFKVLCKTFAI